MSDNANQQGWVYVFVTGAEGAENFLGLHDQQKGVDFIPAFRTKEEANDCFLNLPREKGKKYELQAVHLEELYQDADKNGFAVALLDGDGKAVAS